jgi:hypothetical protein
LTLNGIKEVAKTLKEEIGKIEKSADETRARKDEA